MMHFVLNFIHKCKKKGKKIKIYIKIQEIIFKENKCGTFGVDFWKKSWQKSCQIQSLSVIHVLSKGFFFS